MMYCVVLPSLRDGVVGWQPVRSLKPTVNKMMFLQDNMHSQSEQRYAILRYMSRRDIILLTPDFSRGTRNHRPHLRSTGTAQKELR